MKTLVIHPEDHTTNFLCEIYEQKLSNSDWNLIRDTVSKSELKRQIKAHDRIIMLGHGTEEGLLNPKNYGDIINSKLVYLLRHKICVCIWCNADVFVKRYGLKGFYTGMIISEYEEALMYSIHSFYHSDIEASNLLFANAIKESIDRDDMLENVKSIYTHDTNPIIDFNKQNIYHS